MMKSICKLIVLALACGLPMTACYTGQDVPECGAANTAVTFRYYPTATEEKLLQVAGSMTHLLFQNDVLQGMMTIDDGGVRGEGLLGGDNSVAAQSLRQLSLNLPEGTYNLVSWTNYKEGISQLGSLTIGQTTRAQLDLKEVHASASITGALQNSERLYFSSVDLTASASGAVEKVVDLNCAHAQMTITVTWRNPNERPDMTQPIRLLLDGVPMQYGQASGHTLKTTLSGVISYGDENYNEAVPAIATTRGLYETQSNVLNASQVEGTLVTYRLTDADHPMLSIVGGTAGELMPPIDMQTFFQNNAWIMDNNRRQYFDIDVVIDGTNITVTASTVTDWVDGGIIGR